MRRTGRTKTGQRTGPACRDTETRRHGDTETRRAPNNATCCLRTAPSCAAARADMGKGGGQVVGVVGEKGAGQASSMTDKYLASQAWKWNEDRIGINFSLILYSPPSRRCRVHVLDRRALEGKAVGRARAGGPARAPTRLSDAATPEYISYPRVGQGRAGSGRLAPRRAAAFHTFRSTA